MDIAYTNALHEQYSDKTIQSAETVVPLLMEWIQPRRVVDVGCGHGYWLKAFADAGVAEIMGVDGDYIDLQKLAIPKEAFICMDLNDPQRLDDDFDLAISIEVAEHLKPECSNAFVEFLCSLSPLILFSAAIPSQPGDHHVNARWPSFWREKFARRGFVALDPIRPLVWHNEDVAIHYRQNMLVFVAKGKLADDSLPSGLKNAPRANCLTLVDEDILKVNLGLKQSLRRIPELLARHLFHRRKHRREK